MSHDHDFDHEDWDPFWSNHESQLPVSQRKAGVMAGEYNYDATARELVSLVCKARSLQEFKRDKVCIRKALEVAHSRGRSEREAEMAAEGERLRDLLIRAENALLPFAVGRHKDADARREDAAHARRIHRMLLDEIEGALAAPATEEGEAESPQPPAPTAEQE